MAVAESTENYFPKFGISREEGSFTFEIAEGRKNVPFVHLFMPVLNAAGQITSVVLRHDGYVSLPTKIQVISKFVDMVHNYSGHSNLQIVTKHVLNSDSSDSLKQLTAGKCDVAFAQDPHLNGQVIVVNGKFTIIGGSLGLSYFKSCDLHMPQNERSCHKTHFCFFAHDMVNMYLSSAH